MDDRDCFGGVWCQGRGFRDFDLTFTKWRGRVEVATIGGQVCRWGCRWLLGLGFDESAARVLWKRKAVRVF